MALRVLKFGGTSVETPARILAVARKIKAHHEAGDDIVCVVSAMGQTTDELIHLAQRVCRTPARREMDMLLTAGERISMALLAMSLQSMGCPAISFTGSQSGIVTTLRHSDARIHAVRPFRIEEELGKGRVVIVAGFQGVSPAKEVTTLGRGGSDTTAVALAIRFRAASCEIYTDVDGVLTADPRVVAGARLLPSIDYVPMIALSHFGGRVLFQRAVRLARKFGISVVVRNAHSDAKGSEICDLGASAANRRAVDRPVNQPDEEPMESDRILGVALESPVTWVRALLPAGHESQPLPGSQPNPRELRDDESDAAPGACLLLARTTLPGGSTWLHWVARPSEEERAWMGMGAWPRGTELHVEEHGALISLIGECAWLGPEVLARAEASLREAGIDVWTSQTSAHALSLLVEETRGEEATRLLHRVFIG